MWVLQATRNEPCRMTLMAGMNAANDALEAFYLTTRLKNRSKVHITESSERLHNGVRLEDLRSFYEVVIGRQWDSLSRECRAGVLNLCAALQHLLMRFPHCAIVKRLQSRLLDF